MRKLQVTELGRIAADAYKKIDKLPVCIVLDNVRSAYNVGAAFRTADAFLIERIHLCGITAFPPHHALAKTALGAQESVDWIHHPTTLQAVQTLKEQAYQIILVEQATPSISLAQFQPMSGAKYALVFGNEVTGVSQEILPLSDLCLEIPQYGTKHSLNVATVIGIVSWSMIEKLKLL